jgi:hypothetical protein
MIDHAMVVLFVGLPLTGLILWIVDTLILDPLHKRNSWQPNRRTCPTCGARTSASRLVAPAPPPIAPQGQTPPAPPLPQS